MFHYDNVFQQNSLQVVHKSVQQRWYCTCNSLLLPLSLFFFIVHKMLCDARAIRERWWFLYLFLRSDHAISGMGWGLSAFSLYALKKFFHVVSWHFFFPSLCFHKMYLLNDSDCITDQTQDNNMVDVYFRYDRKLHSEFCWYSKVILLTIPTALRMISQQQLQWPLFSSICFLVSVWFGLVWFESDIFLFSEKCWTTYDTWADCYIWCATLNFPQKYI